MSSKKVFSAFTHSLLCLRHRLLEFQKTWSLEEQKGSIQQNITKGHWLSFFLKFSSYLVISIIVASSIYLPEQTNLVSNDLYIWFLLCVLYLYMGYYLRLSLEAYNNQTNHCVWLISLHVLCVELRMISSVNWWCSPVQLRGGGGPAGWLECPHEPFLVSESMAEVAAMTIRADDSSEDHPANFCLVAGVADHRPKLLYSMGELAVVSIGAAACFLPFVAKLGFEHALVVHLKF